jgi:hypothetical protein
MLQYRKTILSLIFAISLVTFLPFSAIGAWCSAIYSQTFIVDSAERDLGDNTSLWQEENEEEQNALESTNILLIREGSMSSREVIGLIILGSGGLAGLALFLRKRTIKT